MSSETAFYLANIIVTTVLALQLSQYWWSRSRDRSITYWMTAVWVFAITEAVFSAKPVMPIQLGLILPTSLVTVGYGMLLLGSQRAAGARLSAGPLILALVIQVGGLTAITYHPGHPNLRNAIDRAVWVAMCLGCFFRLKRASPHFWRSINSPAKILLLQALFLGLRGLASIYVSLSGRNGSVPLLRIFDSMDVILFNGALFISLLLALLNVHHEELASARVEMETLSGLLPVCAWCKKVRDDDGYWREIADYFAKRSGVTFTHGVCQSCLDKYLPGARPSVVKPPGPGSGD